MAPRNDTAKLVGSVWEEGTSFTSIVTSFQSEAKSVRLSRRARALRLLYTLALSTVIMVKRQAFMERVLTAFIIFAVHEFFLIADFDTQKVARPPMHEAVKYVRGALGVLTWTLPREIFKWWQYKLSNRYNPTWMLDLFAPLMLYLFLLLPGLLLMYTVILPPAAAYEMILDERVHSYGALKLASYFAKMLLDWLLLSADQNNYSASSDSFVQFIVFMVLVVVFIGLKIALGGSNSEGTFTLDLTLGLAVVFDMATGMYLAAFSVYILLKKFYITATHVDWPSLAVLVYLVPIGIAAILVLLEVRSWLAQTVVKTPVEVQQRPLPEVVTDTVNYFSRRDEPERSQDMVSTGASVTSARPQERSQGMVSTGASVTSARSRDVERNQPSPGSGATAIYSPNSP